MNKLHKYKVYRTIVILMMCVIFCVNMTGCGETKESTIKPGSSILVPPKKSIKEAPTNKNSDELTITGVLSYNDKTEKKAHFVDISSNVEYEVPYSGGTDIQSKYGTVISPGSMQLGAIYDVVCYKSGIAKSIYGNKNEWEKKSVNDIEVDESSKKIVVGASNLKYDEKIVILSGDDRVAIASIIKQDEVTIRGIDNTAYSIIVNVDHGYIRFTGVSAFIGGYVTIGRDNMYTVTEDMLVASKVGNQQIEIQSGNTKSTKEVTVEKGQEAVVDFSEFILPATKQGAVIFKVSPSDAIMSIDGKEVDYSEPIQLTYGKHNIRLVANHYEEYTETIVVNSLYFTKVIDMTPKSAVKSTTKSSTNSANSNLTEGYSVQVVEPQGAALYVDSVYIGIVPCAFDKKVGTKTITLTKSGYNTISYSISIGNTAGDLTYSFPQMEKANSNGATQTPTQTPTQAPTQTPTTAAQEQKTTKK
jgi:hypothetical protein